MVRARRGAPHAHRASQLDLIRDALAPLSTDDGGPEFVNAVQEVAHAMGKIVTSKTAKAEVSQKVSDSVSATLVQYCERCQARHVPDGLFRAAGRQAQLVIGPEEERATMLYPRPRVQQEQVEHPREHLLRAYFRVNGPTSLTHYRDWQQAGTTGVGELWDELRDHLVRVQVDGKRLDVPDSLLESVQRAGPAHGVALVPPNDPYLRQTDR
ncbi:MAG: crosslink repair DNA glycosylase YcaQ family protein, partial [Marmoricola sp.]